MYVSGLMNIRRINKKICHENRNKCVGIIFIISGIIINIQINGINCVANDN